MTVATVLPRQLNLAGKKSGLILLCSEGHGRGKGVYLQALGRVFEDLGHRTAYAVPKGTPAHSVLKNAELLLEAPIHSLSRNQRLKNIATCGDLLFNQGFGGIDMAARKISEWRGVLAETRPDLVVSDWAPSTTLAARGQVPVLVTGNAFFTPPADLSRFPPLHDLAPVQVEEERMLSVINKCIGNDGAAPLQTLPELFLGQAQAVRSFACLDPYHDWLNPETMFAPASDLSRLVGAGDEIFVYIWLPFNQHLLDTLVDALCRLVMPVRTFSISFNHAQTTKLEDAGVIVEREPVDQEDILSRSRLVVHGGGSMLAGLLVASAMPQIILPRSIEDLVISTTLQKARGCRSMRLDMTDAESLSQLITSAYEDDDFVESVCRVHSELTPKPTESWANDIAAVGHALL